MKKSILISFLTVLSFSCVKSLKADVIDHTLGNTLEEWAEREYCREYSSGNTYENNNCVRHLENNFFEFFW